MNEPKKTISADEHHVGLGSARQVLRSLPMWKRIMLALSVALMVTGLLLQGYTYARESSRSRRATDNPQSQGQDLGPNGQLLPRSLSLEQRGDQPVTTAFQTGWGVDTWSPMLFRTGFGFFAGFCVGYAARAFLKIAALSLGLVFLLLVGLQYTGVIDVDWTAVQHGYAVIGRWLQAQFTSIHQFVTGYLPSTTMGGLGLLAGFKISR